MNEQIARLIETLELQAQEIAAAGHAGWGNTMLDAAQALRAAYGVNPCEGKSNG